MIKKAFCMKVYPDKQEEYQKRHEELWPEMREMLAEHGAISYSIFLEPTTSTLFAYLEIADEERWSKVPETAINQKWWHHMADIMETNNDDSPITTELNQVFEL